MLGALEQAVGALLTIVVLLDVFLTVLYARMGKEIISTRIAHLTWNLMSHASRSFGRSRHAILSFCGPIILVALVVFWAVALTCGTAMIIHPQLGIAVTTNKGATPTDFISAIYAGGSSMAIVGSSDFVPRTRWFRIFYLFNSLVGATVLSLTLTYLMQVYGALLRRNALGLKIHLLTGATGNAAELVAALGPAGQFSNGYTHLASLADEMVAVKESHHFYPVLFYFRFDEPLYSVSRFALIALDAVTLIQSGLDERQYSWLQRSAAVIQLKRAALLLITTLEKNFLGNTPRNSEGELPDERTLQHWHARYCDGLRRLRHAGIKTTTDEQAGTQCYLRSRAGWDRHITRLASSMTYDLDEIDPVIAEPDTTDVLQEP